MSLFAAPDVTDRLILSLAPPPEVADQMALAADQVRATFGLHARMRPRDQLSLALHSLGDHAGVRRDIVSMTAEAAASVEPPGPIAMCFDRAEVRMSSPARFDLVLTCSAPSPALEALHKSLGLAMARAGIGRLVDRQFEPHITVIDNIRQTGLAAPIAPIHWTATSFCLLHVLLIRQIYVPLGRWTLLRENS